MGARWLLARPRTAMRNFSSSPRSCANRPASMRFFMAANQSDNLFDLRCAGRLLFRSRHRGSAAFPAWGTNSRCNANAGPDRLSFVPARVERPRNVIPLPSSTAKIFSKAPLSRSTSPGVVRKLAVRETESKSSGSSLRDFQAKRFHARKEFGVGVAEKVDRLHGVADHEAAAPRRAPATRRSGWQATGAGGGWCPGTRPPAGGECSSETASAASVGRSSSPRSTRWAICATSMKSTAPASAKTTCSSPAAWRSSVKQAFTIFHSSSV